jgi:hypothetical protein
MNEFIKEMRQTLSHDQWVAMMRENKAMREAGKSQDEILAALQAKYAA